MTTWRKYDRELSVETDGAFLILIRHGCNHHCLHTSCTPGNRCLTDFIIVPCGLLWPWVLPTHYALKEETDTESLMAFEALNAVSDTVCNLTELWRLELPNTLKEPLKNFLKLAYTAFFQMPLMKFLLQHVFKAPLKEYLLRMSTKHLESSPHSLFYFKVHSRLLLYLSLGPHIRSLQQWLQNRQINLSTQRR